MDQAIYKEHLPSIVSTKRNWKIGLKKLFGGVVGEAEGEWPEVSRDQQLGRGSAHENTNRLFE